MYTVFRDVIDHPKLKDITRHNEIFVRKDTFTRNGETIRRCYFEDARSAQIFTLGLVCLGFDGKPLTFQS